MPLCLNEHKINSFKDDQVFKILNMLLNNNKIELPEPKRLKEVAHTNNPKYFPQEFLYSNG